MALHWNGYLAALEICLPASSQGLYLKNIIKSDLVKFVILESESPECLVYWANTEYPSLSISQG